MVPPPLDQSGRESMAAINVVDTTTRSLPSPFLTKTYQLVDDKSINDVISWNEDGSTFIVWNPIEFAKDLLPKYFKHNNFSSFVRQLNTYGFRKVVPDRWEFANECFRIGEKRLLCEIQRRKITPVAVQGPHVTPVSMNNSGEEQVMSSNSSQNGTNDLCSGGIDAELIGENERLRRENVQLNKELSNMKQLCSSIYLMMSNYARNSSSELASVKPLDLLPLKRSSEDCDGGGGTYEGVTEDDECANTKLFGVAIEVKRAKEGEGDQLKHVEADAICESLDVKSL